MSQTLNNDASIHNHTQPRAPLSCTWMMILTHSLTWSNQGEDKVEERMKINSDVAHLRRTVNEMQFFSIFNNFFFSLFGDKINFLMPLKS